MGRQMQDVFSQMFLRLVRVRYRRRLMQVVPSLALRLMMRLLFAGEQAACVKMQNLRHRYFSVLLGCVPGENCPPSTPDDAPPLCWRAGGQCESVRIGYFPSNTAAELPLTHFR